MSKQAERDHKEIAELLTKPNAYQRLMFVAETTQKPGTRIRFLEAARNLVK